MQNILKNTTATYTTRHFFCAVCLVASLFSGVSPLYAAYESGDGKVVGSPGKSVKLTASKNVWVDYKSDSVAGQGYLLGTYHTSGSQTFGTSAGDTKVYRQTGTSVPLPDTVPTGSATADFTGWTML
jgi:hypothetical protein